MRSLLLMLLLLLSNETNIPQTMQRRVAKWKRFNLAKAKSRDNV
jgi:hypothetical protein